MGVALTHSMSMDLDIELEKLSLQSSAPPMRNGTPVKGRWGVLRSKRSRISRAKENFRCRASPPGAGADRSIAIRTMGVSVNSISLNADHHQKTLALRPLPRRHGSFHR
jgi:hypothetical protein